MAIVAGIDLGTTNSAVAVLSGGAPVVLGAEDDQPLLPSLVWIGEDGEILVGRAARERGVLDPAGLVTHVKRHMGAGWKLERGGKVYTAPMVSSFILRRLKDAAQTALGQPVQSAIITVPAYFNDNQRKATQEAGELAGLKVLRLINEPTAASLAYGLGGGAGLVLVFDLGGGTFDVSLLSVEEGVFEVLATRGINQLGGADFDQALLKLLVERYQQQFGEDPTADPLAAAKFLEAAEKAKMDLSALPVATVDLPFVSANAQGPIHFRAPITRETFEALLAPFLEQLNEAVDEALRDAQLAARDIEAVVLVGGSTRIPIIGEMLEKRFPGRVRRDIHPEECVALGAAAQGGVLQGQLTGLVLVDVTPLSLGVETEGDVFVPVIGRNTALPARARRLFTTISDFQRLVDVQVLQGERLLASKNVSLGQFGLTGLHQGRAGETRIEVTFEIDVNGMVRVWAHDLRTGAQEKIDLVGHRTLTPEEIAECVAMGDQTRREDEQFVERARHSQQARDAMRQARALLGEATDLPRQATEELLSAIEDLEQALALKETSVEEITRLAQGLLEMVRGRV